MRELFNCEVGLSDHTMGIGTGVAAVAQGATVIEKHFTIRRSDGGVDSAFSMEPEEMKQLVIETKRAWQSLGKVFYGPTEVEKESKFYTRSLYIAKDMKKGDVLTEENLCIIRPGLGLSPKYYDVILGRKVTQNLIKGTAVSWALVS
jgi:N-acetylneuraminate synthase